ncbi:carbohydrate ABC transporter permease [Oerskovia enterophila]|uniref:L-arabinose transport system permease protein AraQ n=1 Tax=Oerskovia enterophila TaxID=43678 RepID=A0A165S3A8_9CELL|nr:carbohydrate ABC transporter permease [Oerskovia enterophila]KZM35493.1 L-arabinose transport system permease protein AraQ [Oerskovia enterophila]
MSVQNPVRESPASAPAQHPTAASGASSAQPPGSPVDAPPAPVGAGHRPGGGRPPQRTRRRRPLHLGSYATLLVATVVMALPLVWMVLASFKRPDELYSIPLQWLPQNLDLANYVQTTQSIPVGQLFLNSVGLTVVGSTLKLLLGLCCAYALVFLDFPFKRAVFVLVLFTLLIPQQITIIPNYTLVAQLGWLNTYQGILVPGLASAFGTFLFRQHFLSLPISILEAAELDGAGHWRKLWRFVVPLSYPTIAAVALVSVVAEWNDYLWPFLVTDDAEKMTLPVGLTLLQSVDGMNNWGVLMAATVLVTLPVLVVFLFLQRRLVAGLTAGAVTG